MSDKLKLGAKNAKLLREQFGLNNIKASDTCSTVAVEKYAKKIGLKELNEQQQEYFDKLKKEKTKDERTSELNNEVLSEKINNIEQKKSTLEEVRAKSSLTTLINYKKEVKIENLEIVITNLIALLSLVLEVVYLCFRMEG